MSKKTPKSFSECGNCGAADPPLKCARCKDQGYCDKSCQKQHWKTGGHKEHCVPPNDRRPAKSAATSAAESAVTCPICLEPIPENEMSTLPCSHRYHKDCIEGLRKFGMTQTCPSCRAALPETADKLNDMFAKLYMELKRDGANFHSLTKKQQLTMDKILLIVRQAADQGDPEAQDHLGSLYYDGRGVPLDLSMAFQWWKKASDQGYPNALFHIGFIYTDRGNLEEVFRCNTLAAEKGYVHSEYKLGCMYDNGLGVEKNFGEAFKWYSAAASQDHAGAQYNLGLMYEQGDGTPQNYVLAAQSYNKAADQGYASAQFNLGILYSEGKGVPKSDQHAVRWWRKAADQGLAVAQFNMGVNFSVGRGVPKDMGVAADLMRKAADQDDADAQFRLGYFYQFGTGVMQSYAEAARWYRKAADKNHARGQHALALLYKEGKGVEKSNHAAREWYTKALANGLQREYTKASANGELD